MEYRVSLTRRVEKELRKLPKHILCQLDLWVKIIETEGWHVMRQTNGYRDHHLKGARWGQHSSSLSRSWRVIYRKAENENIILIEVLEVNHHEYKK